MGNKELLRAKVMEMVRRAGSRCERRRGLKCSRRQMKRIWAHGVYQDRFVKELRLAGIHSIELANRYLEESYLPAINRRLAKMATEPEDAHVPLVDGTDLRDAFCFEENRVVCRDFVLQFERRLYQIPPRLRHRPQPPDKVVVRKRMDGS